MQFTKTHKAEIEQFMQAHNAQISAVKAEIKDAIDNGDFNFEEYQKEIKATFNQHMAEYNAATQAFETGHQKEIAQFMSDHKEQVAAIKGQIDSGIRNGSFDFAHFKPAIEAMISEHESTATQYKDTAKKTLNKARTTVQGYMNKATEVTSRAPESQDDGYTMSALDTLQQQLLTAAPKMQQWVAQHSAQILPYVQPLQQLTGALQSGDLSGGPFDCDLTETACVEQLHLPAEAKALLTDPANKAALEEKVTVSRQKRDAFVAAHKDAIIMVIDALINTIETGDYSSLPKLSAMAQDMAEQQQQQQQQHHHQQQQQQPITRRLRGSAHH